MNKIESIEDIVRLVLDPSFEDWQQFGHVTVRRKDDLLLFNYNAMAQYSETWTYFERVSRGLIINHTTGEIVARSFDKFFNWNPNGQYSTDAPIISITEKMDGSLGILYRVDGEYRMATRGAFESEQALWATDYLNQHYALSDLSNELTLLFEIIYPKNRVVVDYGKREDLVLLAARNRFTGDYLPFSDVEKFGEKYDFALPKTYDFADVDSIIDNATALDANHEGYVAEFADGSRFKFKSLAYLKLHKLISTLTLKNVLKAMQAGTIEQILETVPDEFLDETRQWINEIEQTIAAIQRDTQAAFDIAPKSSRKEFAQWVMTNHQPLRRYLFAMLDEKDIVPLIYQHHDWDDESKL